MKKYFYSDGANSHGPFTLQELKNFNINQDTMIWFEGMANWQVAGSIPELSPLFSVVPPPAMPPPRPSGPPSPATQQTFQKQQSAGGSQTAYSGMQVPPKKWLIESIIVTIFCCLPIGILGIVNAIKVENLFMMGDYNGALQASKSAGKWVKFGIGFGLAVILVYVILMIAGVGFTQWYQ